MTFSPIVLFVYNRPWHTRQTLESLANNELADESTLYIYADGPKPNASDEQKEKISEVRQIIREKQWCKDVQIIESSINKGLADSIIEGVTEIVNKHGKIIVLEDDIVTSKGFLKFMNDALSLYKDDEKVMQVSGYIYPHAKPSGNNTYFLKIFSCWGWATWKRAWDFYDHDIDVHLKRFQTKKQKKRFDIEGNGHFYWQLVANKNCEIYTWAVRWYASWLYVEGYSIFPSKSLIINIGLDGSGQHCLPEVIVDFKIDNCDVIKQEIAENLIIRRRIDLYFKKKKGNKHYIYLIKQFLTLGTIKRLLSFLKMILSKKLIWYELQNILVNSDVSQKSSLGLPYNITNVKIGDYTYIKRKCEIHYTTIGKFCSIGKNFTSGNGIHPLNGISTSPMFYSNEKQNGYSLSGRKKIEEFLPVTIGNDVFIGDNVTVLSGIKIGDGAVIGAGAVVSKDIPPFAIAVGCPIKVIRYRFSEEQIQALLKIKWWNFSEEKLMDIEKYFFDIDTFIKIYSKSI